MRPQPGIWVISSARPRASVHVVTMCKAAAGLAAEQARVRQAHEHLAEATAAHADQAQRGAGQRAGLVAGQDRDAATAARAEATAASARAGSASAEVERMGQDAGSAPGELRASMQREREETAARLAAALQAARAAATRLGEERTTHSAEAGRIEREELRQVPGDRASVLEEARLTHLPARAGRAGREVDHVRAERAELDRA